MHPAGTRRVPVERARHAKRLGHVQNGPGAVLPVLAGNDSGTTATTTQGPATTPAQTAPATSTTHTSSSSAPASPPTTLSSSAKPSSATTPSSSSLASSTGTLTLTSPSLSSSASTPPDILTATIQTPSLTPTPTPQTHAGAAQNSGLSGGAIAGIIAGGAIVGAALIVFIIRKTYLRRRRQRISWTGAPRLGAGTVDEPKLFPDVAERRASLSSGAPTPQRTVPPSPFMPHGQSMYTAPVSPLAHMQPPAIPTYAVPTPLPATYNNPAPVAAYPMHPASLAYGPGNPSAAMAHVAAGPGIGRPVSSVRAQHAPMEATVKCAFVPTLPDELSITTGERVVVLERYDDGWDLCSNARGERGMVPRECLEQALTDLSDAGWRNAGRASSLNPDRERY